LRCLRFFCLIALLAWVPTIAPSPVLAGTNAITAGIGGLNNGTLNGGDGTGTGQITLNSVTLALVKQARDLSGTVLPDGFVVSVGQAIYFVLYVDNITNFSANNIQITDLLDESQFTYLNSLETTLIPSGSNDAAIWAGAWSGLTDVLGSPDDLASATDTGGPSGLDQITIGTVSAQVNQVLDISANQLRAFRFRVTVN